ncbi:MAG: thymidine phosphorylase [Calditrichaeota bacterium]|nr:MAG: thymidine phosphorylase [Calditrichota bacterium]
MNPVEIIVKKRDGKKLTKEEISFLIKSYVDGSLADYQMSAFAMAVYFNGLTDEETSILTFEMINSGETIDLSQISGLKIDKHSTGGVGDKTSMILAPLVASFGIPVPMMSGRGLGHTGGTLDKLESIPGFRVDLEVNEFKKILSEVGFAMMGQTKDICPADKKLYSLRDVTGTVASIPLICASIMGKKIAEGIDGLVLDVKTGSGAFIPEKSETIKLAQGLVRIGELAGKKTIALLTDMSQPLGNYVGNWLEIKECIEILQDGKGAKDLVDLTLALSGAMLLLGKKTDSISEGIELCRKKLESGEPFELFKKSVVAQGGDLSVIEKPDSYPKSKFEFDFVAEKDGFISEFNNYEIGMTAVNLGAGRMKVTDKIEPKAGMIFQKRVGSKVKKGEGIAKVFTELENSIEPAKLRLANSVVISEKQSQKSDLIQNLIDSEGIHEWNDFCK